MCGGGGDFIMDIWGLWEGRNGKGVDEWSMEKGE